MFRAETESRSADAAEPALPAAPPLLGVGADAGAEPWYRTIAKLMQGRNRTFPHTLANLDPGAQPVWAALRGALD